MTPDDPTNLYLTFYWLPFVIILKIEIYSLEESPFFIYILGHLVVKLKYFHFNKSIFANLRYVVINCDSEGSV